MKYKLKFELAFSNEIKDNKPFERDIKIRILENNATMEIESDYPINIPAKNVQVILGKINFVVVDISYEVTSEEYISICKVSEMEYLSKVGKIINDRLLMEARQMEKMKYTDYNLFEYKVTKF
jgi:hypothetical protein